MSDELKTGRNLSPMNKRKWILLGWVLAVAGAGVLYDRAIVFARWEKQHAPPDAVALYLPDAAR